MKKNGSIVIAVLALCTLVFCVLFFSTNSTKNDLNAKNAALSAEIEGLRAEAAKLTADIATAAEENAAKIDELNEDAAAAAEEAAKQISALNATIAEKDEAIAAADEAAEEAAAKIAEQTETINTMTAEADEAATKITALSAENTEKDTTIADLNTALEEAMAQLATMTTTAEQANDQLIAVLNTVDSMWQFTGYQALTEEAQNTFDAVTSSLLGVSYKALGVLATREISKGYFYVATSTVIYPDAEPTFVLLQVENEKVVDIINLKAE